MAADHAITAGAVAYYVQSAAWGDANGDGLLDLAVAWPGTNPNYDTNPKLELYINLGAGAFSQKFLNDDGETTPFKDPPTYGGRSVAWADYDNDGDL